MANEKKSGKNARGEGEAPVPFPPHSTDRPPETEPFPVPEPTPPPRAPEPAPAPMPPGPPPIEIPEFPSQRRQEVITVLTALISGPGNHASRMARIASREADEARTELVKQAVLFVDKVDEVLR